MTSRYLPCSARDVNYSNAKVRHRSPFRVISQTLVSSKFRCTRGGCSVAKFVVLLMIFGVIYLILLHKGYKELSSSEFSDITSRSKNKLSELERFWRRPPRLPPRFSPNEINNGSMIANPQDSFAESIWVYRQAKVKEAFIHAWSGYRNFAMGYDELMPLSQRGFNGLGGLGSAVVDSLDTAMIMGVNDAVKEAGQWIEKHLTQRIMEQGQVNLFETTIRILGGLLSAYHLAFADQDILLSGAKPDVYLETAKTLADRLLLAFTSSPTPIPFSDVVLRDPSAHPAPDGLSSTAEVTTLQLEFNFLSQITGDPKYSLEAMSVLEHIRALPKVEGLVPIYISPHSGQFSGENIRLGSRGDSYYEYLVKVWLQQPNYRDNQLKYLREMYDEAMTGVKHLLVRKSLPMGLTFVGELPYGAKGFFSPKMDHLVCFLPGTLALGATKGLTKKKSLEDNLLTAEDLENLNLAENLVKACFEMYEVTSTGLAPEIAYFNLRDDPDGMNNGGNKSSKYIDDIVIKPHDRHNLLRPETVESLFVLYRLTENPQYREWGWQIFKAFEKHTKVESGGYTSLDDVTMVPPPRRDKMETFFLGETLKYMYLLFGDSSVLPLDRFIFNTEAHPLPVMQQRATN